MSDPGREDHLTYWNAYYGTIAEQTSAYSGDMADEFPNFFKRPQHIFVRIGTDGVLVTHEPADNWGFQFTEVEYGLERLVGELIDVSSFGPGELDVWFGGPVSLEARDAITGEVLARNESSWDRLDAVDDKGAVRWDPRFARISALRDFASALAGSVGKALGSTRVVDQLRAQIEEFEALLATGPAEEPVQAFLSERPMLLAPMAARVVPKIQLGTEFVTDFVVIEADGDYLLVELESPRHLLFTKNGDPRAALTHALRQVGDWRAWVRDHVEYARSTLPGITDPRALVVIGREEGLQEADRRRLQHLNADAGKVVVVTYDWLITRARQFADNLDRATHPVL